MYAIGGARSIEMFDQTEQRWSIVQEMDTKLCGMKAISLPDGIYIIGGTDNEVETNQMIK